MAFIKHSEFLRKNQGDVTVITLHATGAVALAETLSRSVRFRLLEIRLHLGAVGGTASEAFTATMDADAGAPFDFLIKSQDMETATDAGRVIDGEQWFEDNDEIDFAYANTTTEEWGLTVIIEEAYGEHE